MKENPTFFDFLNLAGLELEKYDWIVFSGVSGSGKSTAIQWLQENRPDKNRIAIDEIQTMPELWNLIRERKRGRPYLIASHIPPWIHRVMKPSGTKQAVFKTDKNQGQVEAWLEASQMSYSAAAIQRFLGRYGASFVDLEFIANSSSFDDFDTALHQFEKLHRIDRTPLP